MTIDILHNVMLFTAVVYAGWTYNCWRDGEDPWLVWFGIIITALSSFFVYYFWEHRFWL